MDFTFSDEDEGLRIANDTSYGLAAKLWTGNLKKAHRLARELRSGAVLVNGDELFDVPGWVQVMIGQGIFRPVLPDIESAEEVARIRKDMADVLPAEADALILIALLMATSVLAACDGGGSTSVAPPPPPPPPPLPPEKEGESDDKDEDDEESDEDSDDEDSDDEDSDEDETYVEGWAVARLDD